MAEDFFSRNFAKDLILVDILKNSSYDNPKNTKQILSELKTRLAEIFPDSSEDNKITATTIVRHVQDMNLSKCFDIRTHKNKKLGYYNATKSDNGNNVVFTSGEFAIISMALHRTPSISAKETQKILSKFENLVDTLGESFNYFLKQQTKHFKEELRKTKRDTLPTVYEISRAIVEERKIQFKLYDPNYFDSPDSAHKFQKIKKKFKSAEERKKARDKIYTVSPYHITCNNDEYFLIAYDPKQDNDGWRHLSHFKISQIAEVKILEESITPIEDITEIAQYLKFDTASNPIFSWIRYQNQHFNMTTDNSKNLTFTVYFKKEFLPEFISLFGDRFKHEPVPKRSETDEWDFQAKLNLPETEGLYQLLMQYSNELTVVSPNPVRDNLIERYQKALRNLKVA